VAWNMIMYRLMAGISLGYRPAELTEGDPNTSSAINTDCTPCTHNAGWTVASPAL